VFDAVPRIVPRRLPVRILPLAALACAAMPAAAQSERYTFTDVGDNVGMSPVINNAGSVLVRRDANLYTGPESRKDRVLPDGHTWTLGSAMNDGGTVVYHRPRHAFTEINPQFTAMNNGGVVAFSATLADTRMGIFTANRGGPATHIATNALAFGSFAPPQINDFGLVAFAATTPGGSERIVTAGVGVSPLTVATAGGAYAGFYVPEQSNYFVDINNAGTVVFHARLRDGGHGIFTGNDPVADKLIAVDTSSSASG
jgi:hypothetical protein